MDLHQLEVFVSVADNKGFLAAAKQLHLSQSTVSAHIASIEEELHTVLIQRSSRTFALTESGKTLYSYALDLLALRRRAVQEVSGKGENQLRIGASSVPAQCLLPQVIRAFHQKNPMIQYEISCEDSLSVIQRVADGSLDAGFVGTKTDCACRFVPMEEDTLVLATPNAEPYRSCRGDRIDWETLWNGPFLVRESSSGTRKEASRVLRQLGMPEQELHIIARIDSAEMIRHCIVQGIGSSIVSYKTVEDLAQQGKLLMFPLADNAVRRELYLVYRPQSNRSKTVQEFLRFSEEFGRGTD
ncbi:MAG: selenium metabolism-associated LysR family transcriptional regulator [Butyricicoccus sp.]